jgi:alpha-ketoglutarate-dependent taurine dioxygenase
MHAQSQPLTVRPMQVQDAFRRFYVDLRDDRRGPAALLAQVAEHGLATFAGVSDEPALLRLAGSVCQILPHPDSAPSGVTVLAGTKPTPSPGRAGLGRAELVPHTDGSSLRHPPPLVMLACGRPAPHGGESLLVDGRALYDGLAAEDPAALLALSHPRAARFGAAPGHLGGVFEHDKGRVRVRFRLDDLVSFSPGAAAALPSMLRLLAALTLRLRLDTGQGYILRNDRWLHGRTAFSGSRLLYRVLGKPLATAQGARAILSGFQPATLIGERQPVKATP